MKPIKIQFPSGPFVLCGTLHLPDRPHPPLVVGSHGLEGSQSSAKQLVLAELLPKNGMAFFRFDHRGCGHSQGEFILDTSLEKRSEDLGAAVAHVLGLGLTSRQFALFGSSMGGAACIKAWQGLALGGVPPLGAVLCAAPLNSATIGKIPTGANGNRPELPLSFFAQNLLFDLEKEAARLHHLLVFHGDRDEVVPVSNALALYAAAESPKELIIQKGCGHQMTDRSHQKEFERRSLAWYRSLFSF